MPGEVLQHFTRTRIHRANDMTHFNTVIATHFNAIQFHIAYVTTLTLRIGNIKLFASHSTIELPKGMPGEVLQHFTRTRILNFTTLATEATTAFTTLTAEATTAFTTFTTATTFGARPANVVKAVRRVVTMHPRRAAMTLPVAVASVAMHNYGCEALYQYTSTKEIKKAPIMTIGAVLFSLR
jgi:hypothetical protein